jgi:hypothetical protein
MTFDVLKKFGRISVSNIENAASKGDMSRDESETSRCCDFSAVEESSSNDDESKLVELQDELKAKGLQLDILRETLSTMSATMRRQEFQLEGKDVQIETYIRLIEEKTIQCSEWKDKYEALVLKIESRVYESEKIQQPTNLNIPTLPASKTCDPLNVSRPWKDNIRHNITTIRDDVSTSSDSISNSYAEIEIDARRCPKRNVRSKRRNDVADVEKLLLLKNDEPHVRNDKNDEPHVRNETIATCHVKECENLSYGVEEMQHIDNIATNSGCRVPKFTASNDDIYGVGLEPPSCDKLQIYKLEEEESRDTIHDEMEKSTGFNFEVEIPFSDPESVQISPAPVRELDSDGAGQITSEVEILSLHHFIQMYDQYQVEDEEINCVADLSTAMEENDAVSVISAATLDSSIAPTCGSTIKNENVSTASHTSSSTCRKTNTIADQGQQICTKTQRAKEAAKLRKRIIRTAKREAKKAQFNCEVVEC